MKLNIIFFFKCCEPNLAEARGRVVEYRWRNVFLQKEHENNITPYLPSRSTNLGSHYK